MFVATGQAGGGEMADSLMEGVEGCSAGRWDKGRSVSSQSVTRQKAPSVCRDGASGAAL